MTDSATTAEPDLTELAPLVRVVTAALRETPLTLGTPAGIADLAATITVRVAAYVGREVLPPGPPAGLTVPALARLLAGAAALTGEAPPYDQLPAADRERYLGQAWQLMARGDGGQQP
ncbi:hypothetical protein [Streptomyces sp. NPDC002343]